MCKPCFLSYHHKTRIPEYFKLIWHINIENLVLEVLDRLREYECIQRTVKKAEVFSKEDVNDMLEIPDTPEYIVMKAYMVVGTDSFTNDHICFFTVR